MPYPILLPTPGTPAFAANPDRRCAGIPFDLFYTEDPEDIAALKRLCLGCPLRDTCREYAIEHHEQGVWGATDERERTVIRNRRAAARGEAIATSRAIPSERRVEARAMAARGVSRDVIAERLHITRRQVDRILTAGTGMAITADELQRRRLDVARLHAQGKGPAQISRELGISRKSAASAIRAVRTGLAA